MLVLEGEALSHRKHTFFDDFRSLRCFAALAFSILCLRRTGVRFDLGSK
jgi:hypothetical protein